MKRILAAVMCVAILGACAPRQTITDPTPTPIESESGQGQTSAIRTMISPSDKNPITDKWTTLGEVGMVIDGEYTDILLATDAKRGDDGYMMWDDTQKWALVAAGEENTYVLFNSRVDGQMYIDVATENDLPVISLVHTSTVGMSVTKYTYQDGAFYAEELITPSSNGNNIYTSFPEYME